MQMYPIRALILCLQVMRKVSDSVVALHDWTKGW